MDGMIIYRNNEQLDYCIPNLLSLFVILSTSLTKLSILFVPPVVELKSDIVI